MQMPRDVSMRVMDDGLVHFVADVTKVERYGHQHTWLLRCGGYKYTEGGPSKVATGDAVTCLVCAEKGPV